jgi:ABC-type nitrate/sulfonate/bicarbonate transport system substrate-binding protein
MKPLKLTAIVIVACALFLLTAGCTQPSTPTGNTTVSILYSKGVGPLPMLLATNQIDGYIAWQPFVAVASESGVGKVISYTGDLPPAGMWKDHPCCALFTRDDFLKANPDVVNAISALTIASTDYINAHKDESADLVADWIAGKGNLTYGNVTVSSISVVHSAMPTVKYTTNPSPEWINGTTNFVNTQIDLGYITAQIKNATPEQRTAMIFNFGPYRTARAMVDNKKVVTPTPLTKPFAIGYLNGDMHSASLIVAIKKYQYFNETYGVALVPRDPSKSKPDICDLVVNGQKIAEVKLIGGDAGPQVAQLAATDAVQMGYIGTPPELAAIDKGTGIKILHPLNTEGSGVVVSASSPASDWKSFIAWVNQRSAEGKPVMMANPGKGSIQDVMLKSALKDSGVTLKEAS